MATDIEESDTDDHERPAPPKRQCTRIVKVNETCCDMLKQITEIASLSEEAENEYDDVEKHAREKLKRWQACQVAKGFVDNTINRVLENYIKAPPSSYPFEDSRFHLFRGNDMEDTAVMMAIRHHGLVQSAGLVSQSRAFYSDQDPGCCTNNDYIHCSCPSNRIESIQDFSRSMATTSANSLRPNNPTEMDKFETLDTDMDKVDDNDQQEDFLERAVAEAIKKKGLSALSVDYG